jgi:hypothetical protein
LAESAFYFWRRELQRRQTEQEQRRERAHAFLPVRVAEELPPPVAGRIEIVLANGRRVHVAAPVDRQALAEVLAVLEGLPC